MTNRPAELENYTLKDEIREYWSARADTFDRPTPHGMYSDAELQAWVALFGRLLGPAPVCDVLELASGTGQITSVLLDMGYTVTALDLSDTMVAKARQKHRSRAARVKFHVGDAENTMMGGERFDAVVCRHLVWTLLDPEAAFTDWFRILKPGGVLLIVDGDWVRPMATLNARVRRALSSTWNSWRRRPPKIDQAWHERIIDRVYFKEGLTADRLSDLLRLAGFVSIEVGNLTAICKEQRKSMTAMEKIIATLWHENYFTMLARRPEL